MGRRKGTPGQSYRVAAQAKMRRQIPQPNPLASESDESVDRLDLARFPRLAGGRRRLYFEGIHPLDKEELALRGYDAVEVLALPRTNELEQIQACLARLQGAEEGTLRLDKDQRDVIGTQLKAYGAFDSDFMNIDVSSTDKKTVEQLLNWSRSTHTLRGNSTVQGALPQVDPARVRSIIDAKEAESWPSTSKSQALSSEALSPTTPDPLPERTSPTKPRGRGRPSTKLPLPAPE